MRLLRELWATSPFRTALVLLLIVIGSAGTSTASACAGAVLVHRSVALFGVLAAGLIAAVTGDVVTRLIAARLTADWSARARRNLCRVALGQDLQALDETPVGELLDRIDGDVYQVASELRGPGLYILQSLSTAIWSVAAVSVVWWPASVAMLCLVAVLVIGLSPAARAISGVRMREEEAWSDLAAVMEEAIHGQDDVRTSLARPYVLGLYARRAAEVLRRGRVVWRRSTRLSTIAVSTIRTGIAGVALTGSWALATGHIDAARLTAVWLLALMFGGTVEQVSRMVPEMQYALGAWGRVCLLAGTPQEPVGGVAPADSDLEIRGLTFRYRRRYRTEGGHMESVEDAQDPVPAKAAHATAQGGPPAGDGSRPPALVDISLTFRRGRSYALVGRTGSGKSTLAKVLARAVDVPRGTVFLGGTDLCDLDLEGLRRWVAVVPQRTEILAGTLAENVALFDEKLLPLAERAMAELGLREWAADLPDGMRTRLGEGGHVLSAGQEQLVAFARILVRDPQIVVLDEATARLDPVTEARVQRATERLLRDRIGIVVAHRISSVRRCDEVVVLADGRVVEAGPLARSRHFAGLMARSQLSVAVPAIVGSGAPDRSGPGQDLVRDEDLGLAEAPVLDEGLVLDENRVLDEDRGPGSALTLVPTERIMVDPPVLPELPRPRTFAQIRNLATNDARYGLGALGFFLVMVFLGLDGTALPWLWAQLVDGVGSPVWPTIGIVAALTVTWPMAYRTGLWFPEWWVRQMLRIGLRLVHGQTGARRVSGHTAAEVVAQGGDTERVVILADNLIDQFVCLTVLVSMTLVSGTPVPGLFFAGTMVLSGAAAVLFGPVLERAAQATVVARAAFATALVSSLSAARTVKLAGASEAVLAHLARLDEERSERQRHEIAIQVWARSTPSLTSGLLPIAVWALYLDRMLPASAALIAISTLGAARWFAWTTASLVSQLPSARVWTRRTVAMTGAADYSASVPGVDISTGVAAPPARASRRSLDRLELVDFAAVHEDGTVGVRDVDLRVERGQLVLVVGPVGSGKSSLLRALAGIVHHTGQLRWNEEPVRAPERFLRPDQVGYVGQLPRVFTGTIAENIALGHEVDVRRALTVAQLDHDLAMAGEGLGLVIGHKGTRLSGGQLQRLALARALAPHTELLVADDVSSALDVTTELALWRALRASGITVVGSTSKKAALVQADEVLVLQGGRPAARGTWRELEDRWGHLAG